MNCGEVICRLWCFGPGRILSTVNQLETHSLFSKFARWVLPCWVFRRDVSVSGRWLFELLVIWGYAAGDVIGDHDHALCYLMVPVLEFTDQLKVSTVLPEHVILCTHFVLVRWRCYLKAIWRLCCIYFWRLFATYVSSACFLEDHYPDLLPSFKELDQAERQSVQFTQCSSQGTSGLIRAHLATIHSCIA